MKIVLLIIVLTTAYAIYCDFKHYKESIRISEMSKEEYSQYLKEARLKR